MASGVGMQEAVGGVSLGEDVIGLLRDARVMLREECALVVSDRRLKKAARLLKVRCVHPRPARAGRVEWAGLVVAGGGRGVLAKDGSGSDAMRACRAGGSPGRAWRGCT
jgi:hypothetical protein